MLHGNWDFTIFAEKTMKRILFLFALFLLTTMGIFAQTAATPDTLAKKKVAVYADTTVNVGPAVQKQQEQPAKTHVRRDTRPLKDRIKFDLNTSFWSNASVVSGQISLLVSYHFPKILSIGTGPTYLFNYNRGPNKNLNGWGGTVFARAQFLKFLYVWTEYQGIDNQYITNWNPVTVGKEYVDSWFVGAGCNIRLGTRSGINLAVLYDLLHGSSSPYSSATTYRVGFSF